MLEHGGGGEAQHVERADEVDVDDRPEGVQRERAAAADDAAGRRDAGAVDGDAQLAERRGALDRGLHLRLVAHVGGDEVGAALALGR